MENSGQEVKLVFNNNVKNLSKLERYEEKLTSLKKVIDTFPKNFNIGSITGDEFKQLDDRLNKVENALKGINTTLKPLKSNLKTVGDATRIAFNYTTLRTFARGLARVMKTMSGYIAKSSAYLEDINLFQVAFDNTYNSAERFINKLTEMYGLDEKWLTRTVGIFKQLSNAMNLSVEQGTKLSTLLTQMSVDISSLYNLDIDRASSVLQSALAGQTKPIRGATGADITQATLQQTLSGLGIDKSVTELSYAEKRLLIIVSLTRQVKESTGDWGRTLESPANQTRILQQQWERLTRTIGNVFLPVMAKILPYLNAILMVITEILSTVASLFGFNIGDYDYFSGIDESVLDLQEDLDSTTDSTEKLKRGLRSFDKLNNITTPTPTKGTGGASVGGGISPKILSAFNDAYDKYFKKLEDVQMKATKIRDAIMEWLGFTKQIDEETGKVSFKFDHITGGTVLGALAVGGIIYKGAKNLLSILKKIGILKFKNIGGIKDFFLLLKSNSVTIPAFLVSIASSYDAMYRLADGTMETNNAILQLTSSVVGATVSGAMFGSQFGVLGAVIGGVTGAVVSLTTAFLGYLEKTNEIEVHNKVFDNQGVSIENLTKKYQDLFAKSITWNDNLENLKNKYEESTTALKQAKDELALFEQQLQNQDSAITKSQLQELNNKYDNLIQKTKDATQSSLDYEIGLINAYSNTSKKSAEATAQQIADLKALKLAQQDYEIEYITAQKNITEEYYTGRIGLTEYNEKLHDLDISYGHAYDSSFSATGSIQNFNKEISNIDYESPEKLSKAIDEVSTKYKDTISTLNKEKDNVNTYYDKQIQDQQTIVDNYDRQMQKGRELTDQEKERYDTAKSLVDLYTTEQENAIETIEETITTISGNYKGFLSSVYADLVSQGANTSKEFSGTISTIEKDLDKLKKYDMSDFGKNLFDSMIKSVVENEKGRLPILANKFEKYGINAGDEFTNALEDVLKDQKTFGKIEKDSEELGKAMPGGFQAGAGKYLQQYGAGGDKLGQTAIDEARKTLDSHSPSKVFEKIGQDVVNGFVLGINDKQKDVMTTVDNLLKAIKDKFQNISFKINISTSVESSFNSILGKLETFISKFRSGINNLLYYMTKSLNNVTVGNDNKIYYQSMPYISVPRFEKGIDFVPHDYFPAYLDYGERVLTKEENQNYMNNNMSNKEKVETKPINQTIILQVGSEQIGKVVLNDLQKMAKSNGKPITIGV